MVRFSVLLIGLAGAVHGCAQEPVFDVASLKQSPTTTGDLYTANLGMVRHGELTMTNVTLSDCLRFAYNITNGLQITGPDWIKNKGVRFDILAKASSDTALDQFPLMLRSLLADRFKLALHHEAREISYLALEVGRKGPKLTAAPPDADASGNHNGLGQIHSSHMAMPMLATLLSSSLCSKL
jgi:uncharacterized protein (TIGR03435 family)